MQAIQAVRSAIAKRPIVGNVIVYGVLYTGAEFIQQTVNSKVLVIQPSTGKGKTEQVCYRYLDSKFVGKAMKVVLPKLAADALIVTPINLTIFYVGMSILERKKDVFEEWSKKILPTFLTASVFWVPASLINFKFLPPQARVIYVGSCQVVWVSILCWFKRQEY